MLAPFWLMAPHRSRSGVDPRAIGIFPVWRRQPFAGGTPRVVPAETPRRRRPLTGRPNVAERVDRDQLVPLADGAGEHQPNEQQRPSVKTLSSRFRMWFGRC